MYIEIILPLNLPKTFTYFVNKINECNVKIGNQVIVQFKSKKLYIGIIESIHSTNPENINFIKPINAILIKEPIIHDYQIKLWKFISKYYCSNLGLLYRYTFPNILKLTSHILITINNKKIININTFNKSTQLILQIISKKKIINIKKLENLITTENLINDLFTLYKAQIINIIRNDIFTKKNIIFHITLNKKLENNPIKLKEILKKIEKKKQQKKILTTFINIKKQNTSPILKTRLLKESNCKNSTLQILEKKNILKSYIHTNNNLKINQLNNSIHQYIHLNNEQNITNQQISNKFKNYNNILLYGETFANKLAIYLYQMYIFFYQKKQVLLLVPEIINISIFFHAAKKIFKNKVTIYHSKLNNKEKADIWINCFNNKYKIIIGTRSSIFLPLKNLNLIIIHDEHNTLYKQKTINPYYHSRDIAWYITKIKKIFCLNTSNSPSLETYYYIKIGKIGLVKSVNKYSINKQPKIEIISLNNKNEFNNKNIISNTLKQEINNSLNQNNQVFIFIKNQYSQIIKCSNCNYIPICKNCNIKLIYYKLFNYIQCYYCNYTENQIDKCQICNFPNIIINKKFSIENIEKELTILYSKYKIQKINNDILNKKNDNYNQFIKNIKLKKINIIIGSYTIIKNLNFHSINLIAVINTESLNNLSNFKSLEYKVQIILQFSQFLLKNENYLNNKIILQTFDSKNKFYENIKNYKLSNLYNSILQERKYLFYPPFSRLIEIILKHQNKNKLHLTSIILINKLSIEIPDINLLGPTNPIFNKINNNYYNTILIKISPSLSSMQIKNFISKQINKLKNISNTKKISITINVDPY